MLQHTTSVPNYKSLGLCTKSDFSNYLWPSLWEYISTSTISNKRTIKTYCMIDWMKLIWYCKCRYIFSIDFVKLREVWLRTKTKRLKTRHTGVSRNISETHNKKEQLCLRMFYQDKEWLWLYIWPLIYKSKVGLCGIDPEHFTWEYQKVSSFFMASTPYWPPANHHRTFKILNWIVE